MNPVWYYLKPSSLAIILATDELPPLLALEAKNQLIACVGLEQATQMIWNVERIHFRPLWLGVK